MDDLFDATYGVYIRTDEKGSVISINSDAFLDDLTGWKKIDEGHGDKYAHAQNHYLDAPLYNMDCIPVYKWDGSKVVPRTAEEIEADRAAILNQPSAQEQLKVDVNFLLAIGGGGYP